MSELLEQQMRQLKLGGMAKEWRSIEFHDVEQYVGELLKLELHEREVNRINRMVKSAGFHVLKTLDDFVWSNSIELPVGLTQDYMTDLSFLNAKENLIFMGTVGTGKTHLATAIALKACQEGRRVRFFTAASLANMLLEKNNKGTLNSYLASMKKTELIVIQMVVEGNATRFSPFPLRPPRQRPRGRSSPNAARCCTPRGRWNTASFRPNPSAG